MFDYAFYFALLDDLSRRFDIRPLKDLGAAEAPRLYLRHDIDLCLDAAMAMAEREAKRGYSATYMFIPTSPLYALDAAIARRFIDLGHEVALHFDYLTSGVGDPSDSATLEDAIGKQFHMLAELSGEPVQSLSFHRPIPQFLGGPDRMFGRVNAYSKTLMDCYRSDSAGRWRQDPHQIPDVQVAQLLTHPIWWGEGHQAPPDRLESWFGRHGGGEELDRLLIETVPGIKRAALC